MNFGYFFICLVLVFESNVFIYVECWIEWWVIYIMYFFFCFFFRFYGKKEEEIMKWELYVGLYVYVIKVNVSFYWIFFLKFD